MVGEKVVKSIREAVKGATYPLETLRRDMRETREEFVDRFLGQEAEPEKEKKSGILGLGILPFPKAPEPKEKQVTLARLPILKKLRGEEYSEQEIEEIPEAIK